MVAMARTPWMQEISSDVAGATSLRTVRYNENTLIALSPETKEIFLYFRILQLYFMLLMRVCFFIKYSDY